MIIEKFIQTPFISYEDKNMVYVSVGDWDFCNPYGVQVFVAGEPVCEQRIFAQSFSMLIPCYGEIVRCKVIVTPFEDLPVEREYTLYPPKHWHIPLLYSSHEDLGYCAYIDNLHRECYEYLKRAMELCETKRGFCYMIEHYWWLDAFDYYATTEEKEQLKKLMRKKKIELNAIHSGIHTSWSNSEQLVRSMYFGCREAKKKYDIAPECAIYTDISGVSWPAVNAFGQMGIKYMAVLANGFRNNKEDMDFPPLFWWSDKSGSEKVLFWYQRSYRPDGLAEIWCDTKRQYPEGEYFFDTTKALRTERWITEKISRIGDVEYDILPLSFYDDRELPTTMLLTVCEEMNKRWKYPKFRMDIPSVFMGEIAEKYGDSLPVFGGDIPDQWADYVAIAPKLTAKRREVSRMLYDAELLSSIQHMHEGGSYEDAKFRQAVWSMSEYDEHCWATSSRHPQKMHRYNIDKVKREPVEEAFSNMKQMVVNVCGEPEGEKISVINTIPKDRCSSLRVPVLTPVPKCIRHQILPDESVITSPVSFECVGKKSFEAALPDRKSVEISGDSFETLYYCVKFSRTSRKITSIIEKETERELLDQECRFELGQFVYLYTENKNQPGAGIEVPKKTDFRIYEGDVAYVIVQEGYEEQSGAIIKAQFIFYKEEKNIDMDLSYKNAMGLIGDFYDRYKKNYFFAFPFLCREGEFFTETACGEMNEKTDRIAINAADFTVTQNWVAAENSQGGVAIYTRDMPVFHIGKIKYNCFGSEFDEKNAHFYLYASSNRCNNLIYTSIEECSADYHLSVLPYTGSHSDIVPQWSDQKDHALLVGRPSEADVRYMKVEQKNIRLVSMKKAEDDDRALVLRFIETAGKETEGSVKLFFSPERIMYATNCEDDTAEIEVTSDEIHFAVKPYSYVTLKVYSNVSV